MQNVHFSQRATRFSVSLLLATAIAALAGCSDNTASTGATTTTTTSSTVAGIQLSGAPTTIKTDNSNTSTITVTAVSATNAMVPNAIITIGADTGLLNTSIVTTDATGKATATFSSGTFSKANRTATLTATAGAATALLPVQIVGSTLTLTASGTSLPSDGTSPVTLTITAKDAGGSPISGAPVTLTQTGSGTVTLTPATGTTDVNGILAVSVAGATAGAATVSAAAVGATSSISFTVAASTSTFGISLVTLNAGTGVVPTNPKNSSMQIGDSLAVQVSAPAPTASVIFATSIGTWAANGSSVLAVTPVAGIATATLNSASAGVASVQVLDPLNPTLSDTLTVGITAKIPAKITLQASPTVIPRSVGSTTGFSNLTAMVYDASGAPVGGAPVAFSIVSPTGTNSGETVSPVVVFSSTTTANGLALGAAPTTFTSGSLSSGAAGVQIRASVVGTAIATQPIGVPNLTNPPSSNDVAVVIGGTAGSVAFGQASKIIDAGGTSTIYTFPMSVLVADSNGSPAPLGTVVNISTWPIAWTTGSRGFGCDPDADNFIWDPVAPDPVTGLPGVYVAGNGGTFYNEDTNENLILDAGEDGKRRYYATGPTGALIAGGTSDGIITPLNSYGGAVVSTNAADLPGTATTDANGLATFNLTYTKSSAIWIISRIRAQATVQGSPAVGQLYFRLAASQADTSTCFLPPSPFAF